MKTGTEHRHSPSTPTAFPEAEAREAAFDRARRRLYCVINVLGMGIQVVIWDLCRRGADPDLTTLYLNPVFFVMCGWMVWWLRRGRPLVTVERVGFVVCALVVLLRSVVPPLSPGGADLGHLQNTYWLLVVVSILSFLAFDYRRAVLASALFYLLSVGLPWLLPGRVGSDPAIRAQLLQVQLLAGVVLTCLWSISGYRAHFTLERERLRLTEHLAGTDTLTGLPNRRALYPRLEGVVAGAEGGTPGVLLLLDLDHFKGINDRCGHNVGDGVLVAVARLLAGHLRGADVLGRWGGEEFVAALPATDLEAGREVAERLRLAVARHPFPEAGAVTLSIGLTVARPGDSLHACLARADAALYRAKRLGRDRVCASVEEDLPENLEASLTPIPASQVLTG